jgi:hypothetical protein
VLLLCGQVLSQQREGFQQDRELVGSTSIKFMGLCGETNQGKTTCWDSVLRLTAGKTYLPFDDVLDSRKVGAVSVHPHRMAAWIGGIAQELVGFNCFSGIA